MNLRLPIVVAVVAAAAGAAALRAGHSAAPASAFVSDPSRVPAAGADLRRRPAAIHRGVVVYVAGDVRRSGLYTLPPGARAEDALRAAGGPGQEADLVSVNLAQELSDGDEVAVPSLADSSGAPDATSRPHRTHRAKHRKHGRKHKHRHRKAAATLAATDAASATSLDPAADTSSADIPVSMVDLNTAGESELETLPGVGATLAARIVSFRELSGPFASPDDLLDVAGVSQSKLDAIEPYLTLGAEPSSSP